MARSSSSTTSRLSPRVMSTMPSCHQRTTSNQLKRLQATGWWVPYHIGMSMDPNTLHQVSINCHNCILKVCLCPQPTTTTARLLHMLLHWIHTKLIPSPIKSSSTKQICLRLHTIYNKPHNKHQYQPIYHFHKSYMSQQTLQINIMEWRLLRQQVECIHQLK